MKDVKRKSIERFGFYEFCVELQKAFEEGYVISDVVGEAPVAYVGLYYCTVIKDESSENAVTDSDKVEESAESVSESKEEQVSTKGRKPKAK